MQLSLDFARDGAGPHLGALRRRLKAAFGAFGDDQRREPVDQLVRSLIAGRTRDADSEAVFQRLKQRYPDWRRLISAPPEEVRALLDPVTFGDDKALWLPRTLQAIIDRTGALDLHFLADIPVEEAMAWLKRMDGVGDKVAAATLNFSTLRRRVMVVDTHVLRVAQRYGLVSARCDAESAGASLMAAAPDDWTAEDFYELHWLMKRLGQVRCTHGLARCGACPLAAQCVRHAVPALPSRVATAAWSRPSASPAAPALAF